MKTPTGADLYARVDGSTKVFLIGAFREDSLNKSTFDLRDKTVLKFDRDKADYVKIDDGKKPVTIAKGRRRNGRSTRRLRGGADSRPSTGSWAGSSSRR